METAVRCWQVIYYWSIRVLFFVHCHRFITITEVKCTYKFNWRRWSIKTRKLLLWHLLSNSHYNSSVLRVENSSWKKGNSVLAHWSLLATLLQKAWKHALMLYKYCMSCFQGPSGNKHSSFQECLQGRKKTLQEIRHS